MGRQRDLRQNLTSDWTCSCRTCSELDERDLGGSEDAEGEADGADPTGYVEGHRAVDVVPAVVEASAVAAHGYDRVATWERDLAAVGVTG